MFLNRFNTLFCLFLVFMSSSLMAQSKGLKVLVELSPAGSFEILSTSIKGKVKSTGAGYVADKISTSVKSFSTGLELRDNHLKDKLEESKYPKITISNAKAQGGQGTADIQVRNVTKKINFKYKELSSKLISVFFNLSLKDFQFTGINYMGVGVKDQVKVEATLAVGK